MILKRYFINPYEKNGIDGSYELLVNVFSPFSHWLHRSLLTDSLGPSSTINGMSALSRIISFPEADAPIILED
jgi:hypothetical protein